MNSDPMRQHWSPYLSMSNNPISSIDPDGGQDDYYFVDGELDHVVRTGEDHRFFENGNLVDFGTVGGMDFVIDALAWNPALMDDVVQYASRDDQRLLWGTYNFIAAEQAAMDIAGIASLLRGGWSAAKNWRKVPSMFKAAKTLSTSSLKPTHYITKSKNAMKALMSDVRANGIQSPIKYVEHKGVKYIVDGHHRYHAAQKLGIKDVPVEKISLPFRGYKSTLDLMLEPGKHPGYWKYMK